jgi:DNA-binding transcriptional MerR regulator/tetratricopeptide (TPR) repeat protein
MGRQRVKDKDRMYRMSALVDTSGVSRDMIKYYLRAGLLPKPAKPRPNLSLYSENHLLLIRLILRIQQQTTLSLPEIAAVFKAAKYEPHTIEIELLSDKYSAGRRDFIMPFDADTKSNVSLSFPQAFIEELGRHGLLDHSGDLDASEMELTGLLWAAHNEGVPLAFFQDARAQMRTLADLEVKALIAIPRPGLDFDTVAASVTNIDRVINRWMISEKTRQARRMFQRIMDNSEKALSSIHQTIYFPSQVFRKRFRVDQELEQLESKLAAQPRNLQLIHSACRACLLLTDFARALDFADAALALAPDNELALAFKSLAYGMDKNLEQALLYAKRLEAADCRHTFALEARLLALLMQAAKLGGVSDTTGLLKAAAELFRGPVSPPRDNIERLEARLLQARANTLFPDAINNGAAAIGDLEALLEQLSTSSIEELELPLAGTRVVYQMYASYYLAQLHELAGNSFQASQYFEKVIQLDPSSNFGEMAYLKLG